MCWVPVQDPVSYAQKALALNEFAAPRWQTVLTPTGQPVGEVVLAQRGLPGTDETWCELHPYPYPSLRSVNSQEL